MIIKKLTKISIKENIDTIVKMGKKIIPIEIQYWEEENYLMEIEGKWEYSIGCFINNEIIGFMICTLKNNDVHVNKMAIEDKYRGNNIGTNMINFLKKLCITNKISKITLYTNISNNLSKNFYEKNGFTVVSKDSEKYSMNFIIKQGLKND